MRGVVLLLVAVAVAPSVQAVPTTLFAHIGDPWSDFPLNTQEPDASFHIDQGIGTATHTLSCLPNPPLSSAFWDFHTLYGFASPNLVEYGVLENGRPRYHPERGIQADIQLDPQTPMVLHWYWSEPRPEQDRAAPAPLPNVILEATMRTGHHISVDDAAYNEGEVLARGRSTPATLAGQFSQGIDYDTVDGRTVYHFVVPMTIEADLIPQATGFNLRVDTFLENEVCGGGAIMPNSVLLHSSPGHRPRLDLGVLDPIHVQYLHPQFIGEDLVLHVSILDVWGPYDLQLVSSNVSIEGAGLPRTQLSEVREAVEPYHGHGPQSVVRSWVLNGTPVPPGVYTVRMSVTTLQGYVATWEGQVELGAQAQTMPGQQPGLIALALVAFAAVAARRR